MDPNSKFSNLLLSNLQREYSLQLALLQMQMLQRSLLLNGMIPVFQSQVYLPSFSAENMYNQIQPLPTQSLIHENTNNSKLELPVSDSKISRDPKDAKKSDVPLIT